MEETVYALVRYWDLKEPLEFSGWEFKPSGKFPADSIVKAGRFFYTFDFFRDREDRKKKFKELLDGRIRNFFEEGNPVVVGKKRIELKEDDYSDFEMGVISEEALDRIYTNVFYEFAIISFFVGIPYDLIMLLIICDITERNPGKELKEPFKVNFRAFHHTLFRGRQPFSSESALATVADYLIIENLKFNDNQDLRIKEIRSAFFWLHFAKSVLYAVKKNPGEVGLEGDVHADKRFLMEWIVLNCICKALNTREIKREFELELKDIDPQTKRCRNELVQSFIEDGLFEDRNIESNILPVFFKYLHKDIGELVDTSVFSKIFKLRQRVVHPFDEGEPPDKEEVYKSGVKPLEMIISNLMLIVFFEYGQNIDKNAIKNALNREYFFRSPFWITIENW